uniref:Uncharacterized protein n=1 Tax=Aegilops tauschii TaxID=37682 RepID=M8CLW5_AEGTA
MANKGGGGRRPHGGGESRRRRRSAGEGDAPVLPFSPHFALPRKEGHGPASGRDEARGLQPPPPPRPPPGGSRHRPPCDLHSHVTSFGTNPFLVAPSLVACLPLTNEDEGAGQIGMTAKGEALVKTEGEEKDETGGRIGREKRGEEPAHRWVLLLLLQITGGGDWLDPLGFELRERGACEASCFLDEGARKALGRDWIGGRRGLRSAAVF